MANRSISGRGFTKRIVVAYMSNKFAFTLCELIMKAIILMIHDMKTIYIELDVVSLSLLLYILKSIEQNL